METAPRPGADNQFESCRRNSEWLPDNTQNDCWPPPTPKYDDWEWVFNKHENLRQLIDQNPGGITDTDRWGRHIRPNLLLADHHQGPVSQAFGWTKIAAENNPQPKFDRHQSTDNYGGDPVEQALLWLIMHFDAPQAEVEIIEIIELLSDGLVRLAHDKLEQYIDG